MNSTSSPHPTSPPPALAAQAVRFGYGEDLILRDFDLDVSRGDFVGLLGPNGSGKSTCVRLLSGVVRPLSGTVLLDGTSLADLPRRTVARRLAVVPQLTAPTFAFTVREFVMMGRTPHLGRLQSERKEDHEVVTEALALTETSGLSDRHVTELSGGELQRVTIARALAQEADILLLDEPTAMLDINHQVEIFELLRGLNASRDVTILCVSHDLNSASEYCPRLVLLCEGAVVADGPPDQVLTAERIQGVYGARVLIDASPSGKPRVTPLSEAAVTRLSAVPAVLPLSRRERGPGGEAPAAEGEPGPGGEAAP
jgi:iron complex transport system ATP-binding protein